MAADPPALQLRLLRTVAEVAAEQNSRVIIVPVPVEMLCFLDRAASAAVLACPSAPEAGPQLAVQAEVGHDEIADRQPPRSALPQQHQLPDGRDAPPAPVISAASSFPMRPRAGGCGKGRRS